MSRRHLLIVSLTLVAASIARVEMNAQAPQPSGSSGKLAVMVNPPAALYVDGALIDANLTQQEVVLPSGYHRLRLIHPDYQDFVRLIRIEPNQTSRLSVPLAEKGVRKAPPPPGRGRGASAGRGAAGRAAMSPAAVAQPGVTDTDLMLGIEFWQEGDFPPAVDTLLAVVRNLAGVPRLVGQQAIALMYLGASFVEVDQVDQAKRAFALAQRTDRNLVARPTEFSRQILAVWQEARAIPGDVDIDVTTLAMAGPPPLPLAPRPAPPAASTPIPAAAPTPSPAPPPPAAPMPTPVAPTPPAAPTPAAASPPAPVATAAEPATPGAPAGPAVPEKVEPPELDPEAPFMSESDGVLMIDFAVPTAGYPCSGTLSVDAGQQIVEWAPKAAGCVSEFTVPFAEVRSPAAAPRGGVLLQFRSDRPSMVLMPAPDADLLEPGAERGTLNDLPPGTRVHTRAALKRIFAALDRPWTDSISTLLVEVPITELVENPTDYDGGIVRTIGKLVSPNPKRGPYFLNDENVNLPIAPAGPAVALLRSRGSDWIGRDLIVSGTFSRPAVTSNNSNPKDKSSTQFLITATRVDPADEVKYAGPARQMTIEQLMKEPPRGRDLIRVIGKYRGNNVFSDLPLDSRRESSDWVIKDSNFAVWVTGKRAAGSGFVLDSSSTRDVSSYWVAVTGTIIERRGFVYLKAEKVELSPTELKRDPVTPPQRMGISPRTRPDIIFTAPSETVPVLPDAQLLVQFTKPMDEKSFADHVRLRYTDGTPETFPYLSVSYIPERRSSVIVDPGKALVPGKTIELAFTAGVKDADNQTLVGSDTPNGRLLKWNVVRR